MSTAILYSGQARTIVRCLPTQHWWAHRKFTDLKFYVLWQDRQDGKEGVKLLQDKYGKENVFARLIPDPTDLPMIPQRYGDFAPYTNAAPHPQLLLQHWYQEEVWKFFNEVAAPDAKTCVIRQRGDNYFHSFEANYGMKAQVRRGEDVTYIIDPERPVAENVCYTPWWGRFGGHQDRFAVMGLRAAASYFTIYSKIQELLDAGCPFHPETLLKARLELGGVRVFETLRAEHSTLRLTGELRQPEIMAMDLRDFTDL